MESVEIELDELLAKQKAKTTSKEVMIAVKESTFQCLKQAKIGSWNDFILALLNAAFWNDNGQLKPYITHICNKCQTKFKSSKKAQFCPTCGKELNDKPQQ